MFGKLRKYIITGAATLLFGLIILAFLLTSGNTDTFNFTSGRTYVLTAADRTYGAEEFKREFTGRLGELEQRNQRKIGLEEAVKNGLDEQLLTLLAAQESVSATIKKVGIKPGAQQVVDQLSEIQAFFDPLTGKFDRQAYVGRLAQEGVTPKIFERGLSDEIARRHFGAGMEAGVRAPRTYGAFQAAYAKENRSLSYFAVDPSKIAPSAKPTDAQLLALMNEFADRLRIPELRELTIVRFSSRTLAATMPVDQDQVQKLYDFRKDQESTPETRTVVQVPAKDAAAAAAIAARLAKGEDPGFVAKSTGGQLITYDGKPKTAIPDRKVAEAAFTLTAGQTSAPIQGDFGFAVVKTLSITPGKTADLAAMRTRLEAEARQNAAELKVSEQADKFQTTHETGAGLAEAAAASGGKVFKTSQIAAQGIDIKGKPAEGVSAKLLENAFKLAQGAESEIESDGRGEYFVVKVEKIVPPSLPPLAEVRPMVERAWIARDTETRLKKKADELGARVRKGESLEAVAASVGATVQKAQGIDRSNARQYGPTLGGLLGPAFEAKKREILVTAGGMPADPNAPPKQEMLVARLDAISNGVTADMAQLAAGGRMSISQQLNSELSQQVSEAARAFIKPKTYPDRAKQALGVEVKAEDKAKTKAKKG